MTNSNYKQVLYKISLPWFKVNTVEGEKLYKNFGFTAPCILNKHFLNVQEIYEVVTLTSIYF